MQGDSGIPFDRLVKAAGSEVDKARVTRYDAYDFVRKDKFTQDQSKFLEKIFNRFGENIVAQIAPVLQAKVSIHLVSVKQSRYHHYLNSLSDPITILTFKINPEARGLIAIDYGLSFGLLDKLMGGRGKPLAELRPFTDLEKPLLQRLLLRFIDAYAESWKEVLDLKPQFGEIEFSPLSVQTASPSDTMVIANYQVSMAAARGFMEMCIPFNYLKEAVPKASFDDFLLTRSSTTIQPQSVAPFFAKNIEAAKVPISVELGIAEVFFQDMLMLEPGDFIRLDSEYISPLKIKVNERTKFLGRPGRKDRKLVVQITRVLTEDDDEYED
ncbi:MAG: FliM/FliN family flagellar motor switch protein [Chloroflexi bacterium]|nr:FliM/FliN family flagellar motor switch protein [Chloroflexota bacterium]